MCSGSGGGGGSADASRAAAEAREREDARQAAYQQGLTDIDRLFTTGQRVTRSDNPEWAAWSARNGDGQTPFGDSMDGTMFEGTVNRLEDQIGGAAAVTEPTRYIETVESDGVAFNDAFYDTRSQAYRDWALPQVEDQWGDTRQELEFWLARRGLTNSTVAADRYSDAETEYGRVRQGVEDEARNLAASARGDVANARSEAVNALTASNDPTAALSVARDRMSSLSSQPTFNPMGTLFANTLASLGAGAGGVRDMAAKDESGGNVGARLYGGTSGSARTVNG